MMRTTAFVFLGALAAHADSIDSSRDPLAIMTKVAANLAQATDARRQYVYRQKIRGSMVRSGGEIARREVREYNVVPQATATDKVLASFSGEYRAGKRMAPYSAPGVKDKGNNEDREMLQDLIDGLVNAKDSRDGIPHDLFPLRTEEIQYYNFTLKGQADVHGRHTYDIVFEPVKKDLCIHVGGADTSCADSEWKGEAWIDTEEFQPVRIETQLAQEVPWGVRVFMGIDVRQLGFSVDYQRVAENVWFPATYGTEFRLKVFWGYKRTITLSMENTGFQKTGADSSIKYELPPQ